MLHARVAEGVHRIEDAYTNWYLIEDGGRLTVVDTGVPGSWHSFRAALQELGRSADDVEAVVLTHAHFDRRHRPDRPRAAVGGRDRGGRAAGPVGRARMTHSMVDSI
jgi:hypothetical protein